MILHIYLFILYIYSLCAFNIGFIGSTLQSTNLFLNGFFKDFISFNENNYSNLVYQEPVVEPVISREKAESIILDYKTRGADFLIGYCEYINTDFLEENDMKMSCLENYLKTGCSDNKWFLFEGSSTFMQSIYYFIFSCVLFCTRE